jgi:ATP-dependent Clp protease ATP-binding subunit ClpA
LLFGVSVHADALDEGFTSGAQIKNLDFPGLLRFRDSLNTKIFELSRISQREGNKNVEFNRIYDLGVLQTEESIQALIGGLSAEITRDDKKSGPLPEVITAYLDSIANIGMKYPHRYLEEVMQKRALLKEIFDVKDPITRDILKQFDQVIEIMQSRDASMVNVEALVAEREAIENTPQKQLERATKILDEGLLGQDELNQALMDMEWRSQLYGKARTLPDLIYLMGLPGTGKDTAAEVFADALSGYEGAWKEHLFRLPVMKSESDLWKVNGSVTGYHGADNFPKFLEFLVLHSDGRYILQRVPEEKKPTFRIIENTNYKGKTLPGYFPPNKGIVFANEFHNWSKQIKDDFLKQAIEKGIFTINAQNGGLAEIHVPIRFVVASNEGIGLVAARETNGNRFGKPMTYEQLLKRWENIHNNKAALKAEILATNGKANQSAGDGSKNKPGISEELANRFNDRFLILMRPLSPEHLRKIADLHLNKLKAAIAESPLLGPTELSWSSEITAFLQVYDYIAEDNARPVVAHVQSLIEEPLLDAVREGKITESEGQKIHLDLEVNEDGTHSLVMEVTKNGKTETVSQVMRLTTKDILAGAITTERIDELAGVEALLKAAVFGVDPILHRLADRALTIENETSSGVDRPANVIMLNGLTSTGKTETAKQYARIVKKAADELKTFDFSGIRTMKDFKEKILGLRDELGNPIPSEFMKLYDRNEGNLVVAFDELANVADLDLLKALYDFFREETVTTFSDGKPRKMGRVTIVVTGNPGIEMYSGVPRDIPMVIQMMAWAEIYRRTADDSELQRQILEKYYPGPLLARIGKENIFFMPPHTYRSLKQLTQLKLGQALERIAVTKSRWGWNIVFPEAQDYTNFVHMIIDEGFNLQDQGASIDNFIMNDFEEPIKALLLKSKAPSGTNVVVRYRETTDNTTKNKSGYVIYNLYVEGKDQPLEFKLKRPYREKALESNEAKIALTGYHEAGHSIVRQALFHDAYYGTMLSVIPGVDIIGDRWLYYLGVAVHEQKRELSSSRDWLIRQIAILLAGETAERIVSKGDVHSRGKENDIMRASTLAQEAIIRHGLSDRWGLQAVPSNLSTFEYLSTLSDGQRDLLREEVDALLNEGRALAEETILTNFEDFKKLAVELLGLGKMEEDQLEAFYHDKTLKDPTQMSGLKLAVHRAQNLWRSMTNRAEPGPDVQLKEGIPVPQAFAKLEEYANRQKQEALDSVAPPANLPVGRNGSYAKSQQGADKLKSPDKESWGSRPTKKDAEECSLRVS